MRGVYLVSVPRRRDIDQLQSEIEELFSDLWQVPRFAGLRRAFRPPVDAYRSEDPPQITVVVELAGIDPSDVHVDATSRTLVIHGARRRPRPGGRYHVMDIDYGPFERTLHFAEDVDVEAATATYRRGLLTIVLPIAVKPAVAARVAIQVRTRG
jgi:HSP20 family protein